MRISDWSSDVCSSDLRNFRDPFRRGKCRRKRVCIGGVGLDDLAQFHHVGGGEEVHADEATGLFEHGRDGIHVQRGRVGGEDGVGTRSEEHTSELQSLMRISYAVFCLKKKKKK